MIDDILGQIVRGVRTALEAGHYDGVGGNDGTPRNGRRAFVQAIRTAAPEAFVAEVKPASPTAGDLIDQGDASADADARNRVAVDRARLYRDYGATAVSVLTERERFGGSPLLLEAVASLPDAPPVLMKDFIISERQLDAARTCGASAILLIDHLFRRSLTELRVEEMISAAHDRDLAVLYEVDNKTSFDHARGLDVDVIGINNRDLTTLEMDLYRTQDILRFRQAAANDVPVLALSGVETRDDVLLMRNAGASGVLVGTTLMASRTPRTTLRALRDVVHVKCCGAGHPDDDAAVATSLAAADAVGVVVDAGGATRERSPEGARRLFEALPPDVERVLVTTCQDPDRVAAHVQATGAAAVQWHVEATEAEAQAMRASLPDDVALILLVRIAAGATDAAIRLGRAVSSYADRLLIEAEAPGADPDQRGGTGRVVDLDAARAVTHALSSEKVHVVLAGGLHAGNVVEAIRHVRPWGVDVSSGIEIQRGRKDAAAIRNFVRAARSVAGAQETADAPRLPMAK